MTLATTKAVVAVVVMGIEAVQRRHWGLLLMHYPYPTTKRHGYNELHLQLVQRRWTRWVRWTR